MRMAEDWFSATVVWTKSYHIYAAAALLKSASRTWLDQCNHRMFHYTRHRDSLHYGYASYDESRQGKSTCAMHQSTMWPSTEQDRWLSPFEHPSFPTLYTM